MYYQQRITVSYSSGGCEIQDEGGTWFGSVVWSLPGLFSRDTNFILGDCTCACSPKDLSSNTVTLEVPVLTHVYWCSLNYDEMMSWSTGSWKYHKHLMHWITSIIASQCTVLEDGIVIMGLPGVGAHGCCPAWCDGITRYNVGVGKDHSLKLKAWFLLNVCKS